jgi:hypothetical protein
MDLLAMAYLFGKSIFELALVAKKLKDCGLLVCKPAE